MLLLNAILEFWLYIDLNPVSPVVPFFPLELLNRFFIRGILILISLFSINKFKVTTILYSFLVEVTSLDATDVLTNQNAKQGFL